MQKFYPAIFFVMLIVIIGQYFHSDRRISRLAELKNEADTAVAKLEAEQSESIKRTDELKRKLENSERSITELSKYNIAASKAANGIKSGSDSIKRIATESGGIIDELAEYIQGL